MRERPILMSAPMVRAILDGTKSQTRRVVKARDVGFIGGAGQQGDPACWGFGDGDGCWHVLDQSAKPWHGNGISGESYAITCPCGAPGDRLWVRETWGMSYVDIASGRPCTRGGEWGSPSRPGRAQCAVYRADGDTMPDDHGHEVARWTPSIHMPRWASRITLEVTSVRVERVQDISEEDAIAEGLARVTKDGSLFKYGIADRDGLPGNDDYGWSWKEWEADPRQAYRKLWDQINGRKPGCAWSDNPWVWVVSFKRVTP